MLQLFLVLFYLFIYFFLVKVRPDGKRIQILEISVTGGSIYLNLKLKFERELNLLIFVQRLKSFQLFVFVFERELNRQNFSNVFHFIFLKET